MCVSFFLQPKFSITRHRFVEAPMTAVSRLKRELREATSSTETDIQLKLADPNDLFRWEATIRGPPDTPFEGATYNVTLRIPSDYPMVPPAAQFKTKVFHPNIAFATGEVCLDILKSRWSPAWTVNSVCRAIANLLSDPEADSPLNCDAGNLVRAGDMLGYFHMARYYAITEAGAPPMQWTPSGK